MRIELTNSLSTSLTSSPFVDCCSRLGAGLGGGGGGGEEEEEGVEVGRSRKRKRRRRYIGCALRFFQYWKQRHALSYCLFQSFRVHSV